MPSLIFIPAPTPSTLPAPATKRRECIIDTKKKLATKRHKSHKRCRNVGGSRFLCALCASLWPIFVLFQLCNSPVDVGECGCELRLPCRMRGAFESSHNFFTGKLQRFDLSREFRIRYSRPVRSLAISLKLFHAFLDPSFVVD